MSAVTVFALALNSLPSIGLAAPISVTASPVAQRSGSGDYVQSFLDLFAHVSDVFSYYQDALASEGYLATSCDPTC